MGDKKNIVFLTGTRADFGKIKALIAGLQEHSQFEAHIFITGMHLLETYGYTAIEVERTGFKNTYKFENHTDEATMDLTLSKTIAGFSNYVSKIKPEMIVIHGDRVEAMAGAIVGSLNNILVAHIEGGELSGTIDELIRHATSKMSHVHFVANDQAKQRLEQMGELPESIFEIGSPDVDIMFSDKLPSLETVKTYYDVAFDDYSLALFHPVTTEVDEMEIYAHNFVEALLQSEEHFVVIYPNNDLGSQYILNAYKRLKSNSKFRVIPSVRFEYFLTLLKNANAIVGNSSAGIREAPYYGVPTINIGSRQENRAVQSHIKNVGYTTEEVLGALQNVPEERLSIAKDFGNGNSAELFVRCLENTQLWKINKQKQFKDL